MPNDAPERDRTVPGQPLPPAGTARPPEPPPPARPRRRWFRGLLYRAIGIALTVPLLFGIAFALLLLGREVTAPGWLKADVEARATELLGGGALRFGAMRLTLGADLHPRVVLRNAELRDAAGGIIAVVPRLTALLSPRGLAQGEVLVQEVDLSALQIALRRAADGSVAFQIGASGAAGGAGAADRGLVGLLDGIDAALEAPRLAALEQVRITGMIVNYDDARAGRSWTVDGGTLALDLRRDRVALRGDLSLLSGRAYLTELGLRYESPNGTRAAEVAIGITNGVARDLASQSAALSWLQVLDAPLDATIRAEIGGSGGLGPVSAALDLGAGALRPTEATRPIPFDGAEAYLTFDPVSSLLTFDRVSLHSPWGDLGGSGRAWLRDIADGVPRRILGQFTFDGFDLNPADLYPEPVTLGRGDIGFRMTLQPFVVEVSDFGVIDGDGRLSGSGRVVAAPEGWSVSADIGLDRIGVGRFMEVWPATFRPNMRRWFAENMTAGRIDRLRAALRFDPAAAPAIAASFEFTDLTLRVLRSLPPIEGGDGQGTWEHGRFTVMLDDGLVRAPQGGAVTLPGTVFTIPDTRIRNAPSVVSLAIGGTLTGALSLLDLPPFEFLTKANLPVTLADARASARVTISLPIMPRVPRDAIDFTAAATLSDLRSEVLIPGRSLAARELRVEIDREALSVRGPMRIGQVPLTAEFRQVLRDNPERVATVSAEVELSERFLDEFRIGLPPGSLRGDGSGRLELLLARGRPPEFALESRLEGLRLAIPALGWAKPAETPGRLSIAGRLGPAPEVDRIALDAAGLVAEGRLELAPDGRLSRALFDRLEVGGWLRAAAELRDRGAGVPMAVRLSDGSLDLRGRPRTGGGTDRPLPPLSLSLDRLTVAESLALTDFRGEFGGSESGLSGEFTARVNGGGAVRGATVPREAGRVAVRLTSDDAGAVISSAGFLRNAVGGALDLTLVPTGGEGTYDGRLTVRDIRVRDAPALASLLDAISVVGLLQQLDGQGLAFSEVEAEFRLAPERIAVTRASAVGASLGISLDGIYLPGSKQIDFQGVVSPLYLINGIGAVLTRPGEGLIGFNFTLTGAVGDVRVGVNPLSVFTPGMFREIFRRPPPRIDQ